MDLEASRIVDAERAQPVVDVVAADQHRNAVAAVAEGDRGAQHDILLALGEQHAARIGARRLVGEGQHRGGRVEPRRAATCDRPPCPRSACARRPNPSPPGRPRRGRSPSAAGSNGRGDDVIGAEAVRLAAIGRGDLLRHLLARELGQRLGGGDLHLLVDRRRAHVERAAEDEGEAEHVVDLVRIVRAAGGDDRVGPRRLGFGRGDLRDRDWPSRR